MQLLQGQLVTPLVRVTLAPYDVPVWCKLEYLNPSGSTKDRMERYFSTELFQQTESTAQSLQRCS